MKVTDELLDKYIDLIAEEVDKKLVDYAVDNNLSLTEAVESEDYQKQVADYLNELSKLSEIPNDLKESIRNEYLDYLIENIEESDKDDNEDDEKEKEDKKDDEKGDEVDEAAVLTKHKKSKLQSTLDKREYAHDFKAKRQNKLRAKKRAARGGKPVDMKISKAVKRTFSKGIGARWESFEESDDEDETVAKDEKDAQKKCDCGKADCPECNPKKQSKNESYIGTMKDILEKSLKTELKVIQEGVADKLAGVQSFETLNESDTKLIKTTIEDIIVEQVNQRATSAINELVKATNDYLENTLYKQLDEEAEKYINESVLPSINNDVNDYLSYMANEFADRLFNENYVVKSKKSVMLESFMDKLLKLIEEEVQIVPEREDMITVLENENKDLNNKIDAIRREKFKINSLLTDARKRVFVLENMPTDLSENQKEQLEGKINELNEADYDKYTEAVLKIINSPEKNDKQLTESNEKPVQTTETKEQAKKNQMADYIKKAMQLA